MSTTDSHREDTAAVKALVTGWAEAFSAPDVESILACYSDDAVLLGTFCSELRNKPEAIRAYFEPYFGMQLHRIEIENLFIQIYGETAVASGFYKVSLVREDKLEEAMARYSLTCLKKEDRWQIVNHHSSVVPQ